MPQMVSPTRSSAFVLCRWNSAEIASDRTVSTLNIVSRNYWNPLIIDYTSIIFRSYVSYPPPIALHNWIWVSIRPLQICHSYSNLFPISTTTFKIPSLTTSPTSSASRNPSTYWWQGRELLGSITYESSLVSELTRPWIHSQRTGLQVAVVFQSLTNLCPPLWHVDTLSHERTANLSLAGSIVP